MGDLLETLFLLALGLFAVAAIGHTLWLAGAALLRALAGADRLPGPRTRHCPRCAAALGVGVPQCLSCGYPVGDPPRVTLESDLEGTDRQIRRLGRTGALEEPLKDRLLRLVEDEREQPTAVESIPRPQQQSAKPAGRAAEHIAKPAREAPRAAAPTQDARRTAEPLPQRTEVPAVASGLVSGAEMQRPAEPIEPRRPVRSLMQAFMEERNIRWGELVSAMLIVGSAVGLVISLWSTLREAIPYFPALVFMLVTAAIHGAGLYTLRRWKLHATSRGLLMISTLLVPLNFLAAIALSDQRPVADPMYLAAVAIGLAGYGAITASSARVLMLQNRWLVFLGVMGASAGQLLIARLAEPGLSNREVLLQTLLPFAAFLAAVGGQLGLAGTWRRLTRRRISDLFRLLGLCSFALLTALGLLAWKTGDVRGTLSALSPGLSLAAAAVLGVGVLVHQRAMRADLAEARTAGTWLSLVGAALMLSAVVFAWPQPALLIAVGLSDFAALSWLGFKVRLPVLHAAAIDCAALAIVVAVHLAGGTIPADAQLKGSDLFAILAMGRSSVVLAATALAVAFVSSGLRRIGRPADGDGYLWGAAGLSVVAVLVAGYAGFISGTDRDWTTIVFAVSSSACIVVAWRSRRALWSWAGSALALVTLAHGLAWNELLGEWLARLSLAPRRPLLVAFLWHATLAGLAAVTGTIRRFQPVTRENRPKLRDALAMPLGRSAIVSSVAILPAALLVEGGRFAIHAGYVGWAAAVWLAIALAFERRALFAAGQLLATISLAFGVTAVCRTQAWWAESYIDPRHLHWQIGALAAWSLFWSVLRESLRSRPRLRTLMSFDRVSVDYVLLWTAVLTLLGLAVWGIAPGLADELKSVAAGPAPTAAGGLMLLVLLVWTLGFLLAASVDEVRQFSAAALLPVGMFLATSAILVPIAAATDAVYSSPVAHAHAYGIGAWIALGVLLVALLASLRERFAQASLVAAVLATLTVPVLICGPFEPQQATATTLRWALALYALVAAAKLCARKQLAGLLSRIGRVDRDQAASALHSIEPLVLVASIVPVLALTVWFAVTVASGHAPAGPVAGSFFDRVGAPLSYAGAIGALAAAVCLIAFRERRPSLALASSLLLQVGVALALGLPRWLANVRIGYADLIALLQWNALALGGFSLGWMAVRRRISPAAFDRSIVEMALRDPLNVQLALTAILPIVLAVWAVLEVFASPGNLPDFSASFGNSVGYAALILAAAALLWRSKSDLPLAAIHVTSVFLVALAGLVAAGVAPASTRHPWLPYHVLEAGWLLVATAGTVVACTAASKWSIQRFPAWFERPADVRAALVAAAVRWAIVVGCLVVLLAVRGIREDPARPWWSAGMSAAVAALAFACGAFGRRQSFAYASTSLAVLAAIFVWLRPWLGVGDVPVPQSWVNLAEAALIALVAAGLVWLAVDVWWQRWRGTVLDPEFGSPPVHQAAAGLGLLGAAVLSVYGLTLQTAYYGVAGAAVPDVSNVGGWLLLGVLVGLTLGLLWDRTARYAIAFCYLTGLIATTLLLDELELSPRNLHFAVGLAGGTYVLVTGLFWMSRAWWDAARHHLAMAISPEEDDRIARWSTAANLSLAAGVVVLEFPVVLSFEHAWMRLSGALAVALAAAGLALLSHGRRVVWLPYVSLLTAGLAAVDLGWAIMPPGTAAVAWLPRSVRLLVVLAIVTAGCAFGLVRIVSRESEWFPAGRRAAATFGAAAVVALLAVLVQEAAWFVPGIGIELLSAFQVFLVAAALVGLAAALIAMAVLPGRDPLQLEERGRRLYVYAAEGVGALLFLHLYLTMPDVFERRLTRYWPFIVMGIAYCGVGLGELFGRLRLPVLAEPLQRTAAFLPLLPAIGFWVHSRVGAADLAGTYSTLLFVVGLLYVVLSMWRQSFVYGLAAALAGNAALWALWLERGVMLLAHPQMWFIPPALSVLIAAHLNRERLGEAQLTAIRYLTITVIYVSSTAEMFIAGAEDLWQPMVLTLLSVLGVFAGILLRVRAFLYLGSSFLLLSIVSMVWHAARNIGHTWPWWAFGVVLGLAILALFGLFEKKRNEVLHVLDELKQWKP